MTFNKLTWVEDVTATSAANFNRMEQGIADAFPHSRLAHCAVTSTLNTPIPNGSWGVINFDTIFEEDIPAGLTSAADLAADRLYARAPGLYVAVYTFYFATNANGRRLAQVMRTKASDSSEAPIARWDSGALGTNNPGASLVSRPIRMAAGDSVFANNFQDSGGALNIISDRTGGASPYLSLTQLGS